MQLDSKGTTMNVPSALNLQESNIERSMPLMLIISAPVPSTADGLTAKAPSFSSDRETASYPSRLTPAMLTASLKLPTRSCAAMSSDDSAQSQRIRAGAITSALILRSPNEHAAPVASAI